MIQGTLVVGKSYITKHGKEVKITRRATEAARVKNGAAFQSDHFTLYKEDGTVALMGTDGDVWEIVREAPPVALGAILESAFATANKRIPTAMEMSLYKALSELNRFAFLEGYTATNPSISHTEEVVKNFEQIFPDFVIDHSKSIFD